MIQVALYFFHTLSLLQLNVTSFWCIQISSYEGIFQYALADAHYTGACQSIERIGPESETCQNRIVEFSSSNFHYDTEIHPIFAMLTTNFAVFQIIFQIFGRL